MIAVATSSEAGHTIRDRIRITPALEWAVLLAAVAVGLASYAALSGSDSPERLIAPPLVALLLVANLIPGILLLMLLGRRVARRRAARSPVGGEGRLHVRLVALFSVVAAVPMFLVTIVASLLFQYGVQFWYSDRARDMLENATGLAATAYRMDLNRWGSETTAMAGDLSRTLSEVPFESPEFSQVFGLQVYQRSLSEGAIYRVSPTAGIQTVALVNPYDRDLGQILDSAKLRALPGAGRSRVTDTGQRIQVLTRIPGFADLVLYGGRISDIKGMGEQNARARTVMADYRALLARARSLQLLFNAALLVMSLLIVGLAVWIALKVADRLVAPVGELVGAARRVAGGDLTARVPDPRSRDEVGTLARVFNQMTGQLEQQNAALENRRALIEAVMAGVSAGVLATSPDRTISIANASAVRLLGAAGEQGLVGRPLARVSPELDAFVDTGASEATVQITAGEEVRTLAVRLADVERGPILTFDDVTQQLVDQRRAAWSDVARRIAHEIKNPLTPIQLAAERLQRRYGTKIGEDDGTFARLTDTIVRQVGDLRRMVDEFSSFARMPKPVFAMESPVEAAQHVLTLHEVAHPRIRFDLRHDDPPPTLVCDRRQIGQALTNVVKNAAEAIEARGGEGGEVVVTITGEDGSVVISVADDGVGLPAARERIVEPYMTTRVRGTGLGLAIVKKIVEEHVGLIEFADRPGGGTVVTMHFDAAALAKLDGGADAPAESRLLAAEA